MSSYPFFLKCFLIGFSAASAVGPIFVLTFNRGAIYGFLKGFATALGAALGDGTLFLLGLLGVLRFIEESRRFTMAMDCIGGVLLILAGIKMFRGHQKYLTDTVKRASDHFIFMMGKSLLLTIVNPLTVLFFMFISIKILPDGLSHVSLDYILEGGSGVFIGSLTLLSFVAFMASRARNVISARRLMTISHISGVIFIIIGVYFLFDFITKLF